MNIILEKIKNKIFKKEDIQIIEGQFLNLSDFDKKSENKYLLEVDENFSHVFNNSNIKIIIETTDKNTYLELFTEEKINHNISIENSKSNLKIKSVGKFNSEKTYITLYINKNYFLNIHSITNKSSCDMLIENITFNQSKININIFGSGNIRIACINTNDLFVNHSNVGKITFQEINSKNVHFNLSKSATIKVHSGKSEFINVDSKDLSKIIAKNFKINHANINLSTTGNVIMDVSNKVEGAISGIGNLQLYNQDVDIDVRMSGLGSVKFK